MTKQPDPVFKVELVSVPGRDDLVAEVWLGQSLLAELRHEGGQVRVQLYPASSGQAWDVPYEALRAALVQARSKLL